MKNNPQKSTTRSRILWIAAVILLLAVIAVLIIYKHSLPNDPSGNPGADTEAANSTGSESSSETATAAPAITIDEQISFDLGDNLEITDLGRYSGKFLEDGSDELVTDILMIIVRNNGASTLQYAELKLETTAHTAEFTLTTLRPGESVLLLELGKQTYTAGETCVSAATNNVVFFQTEPTLCEDILEIETLNGAFNVTNISGKALTGDIFVYYKNCSDDLYYGGITYRARIEGGLGVNEIRQVVSSHYSANGSEIMFVTCSE